MLSTRWAVRDKKRAGMIALNTMMINRRQLTILRSSLYTCIRPRPQLIYLYEFLKRNLFVCTAEHELYTQLNCNVIDFECEFINRSPILCRDILNVRSLTGEYRFILWIQALVSDQMRMLTVASLRNAVRHQALLTIKRLSSTAVSTEANTAKLHAILTGPTGESCEFMI